MLANWVKATTATAGTGSLTLSAVSGFPQFSDAFAVGQPFTYALLLDSDGSPVEIGIGRLTSSTVMSRDKILATYSGGTYVDEGPAAATLSGATYRVVCTIEAGMVKPAIPAVQGSFGSKIVVPDGMRINASVHALPANTMRLSCLSWNTGREISNLVCEVTTAGGTGANKIRLGIYACGADGLPGALLCQTLDIDPSTSGYKARALAGGNIRLPPGWYWFAILSDVAVSVRGFSGGATQDGAVATPMGHRPGTLWIYRYGYFPATVGAGWSSLPSAPTLADGTTVTNDYTPMIGGLLA